MSRSKRKHQVRALAEKTGKRNRGAANILNREAHVGRQATAVAVDSAKANGESAPPAEAMSVPSDPITELIAEFRAFHISSILVGRIHAGASGHDLAEVRRRARELADHPRYYGQSAFVQKEVSFEEMRALIARGATEEYDGVQRIDVFRTQRETVFSVPCANCGRWIYCGHEEHRGRCKCGQAYHITFDAETDWNLPQGCLCMNCGEPFQVELVGHARSPWHAINERQTMCDICFHMSHVGPWWVRKRAAEREGAKSV